MPSPTSSSLPKKLGRDKILNVIYFVDSSKTHSFKLSLLSVRCALAGLALLVVWSFASFLTILFMMGDQREDRDRLKTALDTVFNFQVSYNKVFEKAYPEGKTNGFDDLSSTIITSVKPTETKPSAQLAAKDPKEAPKIETTQNQAKDKNSDAHDGAMMHESEEGFDDQVNVPTMAQQVLASAPAQQQAVTANAEKPKTATETSSTASGEVSVTGAKPKLSPGLLQIDFGLRNSAPPSLAQGFVWGVATFQINDGKNVYVGAPRGIQVQPDGNILAPKASFKYSIRNYKAQTFDFRTPGQGRFVEVEIVLMDGLGKRSSYKVPINDKGQAAMQGAVPTNDIGSSPVDTDNDPNKLPGSTARLGADDDL